MSLLHATPYLLLVFFLPAGAQVTHPTACSRSETSTLAGTVRDSTLALIPGATVTLDNRGVTTTGRDGGFRFDCISPGYHNLSAAAPNFAVTAIEVIAPHRAPLQIVLHIGAVQQQVNVDEEDSAGTDPNTAGATAIISGRQLEALADDPDDLLRQLQQLGATSGGNPAGTIISVNGFQGSSKLPPKSAIAYIRINPDLYSAEFQQPPYTGGRVEIYTKPGQKTFHGALFATNGSPWENARDPFSPGKAAIGKQRYGFELTGPLLRHGSDFALTLEHRAIDNFAVVDAVTLDSSGNQETTTANVPIPQALWVGEARLDWQLGAKNTFIFTYDANVNGLQNLGVGGTMLADTGYNSRRYDHILRFTDITLISPKLMNEARVALRRHEENDVPLSTAPQVQVAGAFTSGGATIGPQQLHELNLEADEDAILTAKRQSLKFGTQLMIYDEHQRLTTDFNGIYTFGGGVAPVLDSNNQPLPGQTETITGLEQYRRALLNLAGGTPTAFSNVTGTPTVDFTQIQDALYFQDEINAGHGLHLSAGLRYYLQNDPTVLNAITPRFGFAWSPGKRPRWTIHGHSGLFSTVFPETDKAEVMREDGTDRITGTVYSPVYGSPLMNATPILSARRFSPHISNSSLFAANLGGTYTSGHGWTLMADYTLNRVWNDIRSANINAPLNGSPTGPRLLGIPNLNLLEMQNSAQSSIGYDYVGFEQHSIKNLRLFAGAIRSKIDADSDTSHFFTPQSTFTDAGEFAQMSNYPVWQAWGFGSLALPRKIEFSGDFDARGDMHYNLTTGFDNNGDGDFNDRPRYAAPGTPEAVATPYGLLVDSGGTAILPRNEGIMPWQFYLDANLQRAFSLTRDPKAEHQQVLTVNLRSSNLLNHTNVTAVGGVLGSPLFSVPYQADNGRRVEAGVRYSF